MLASLRAHSARLFFSSLAIILGVGFAAGTFVLTDTIEQGYESSFAADARRLDVVATRDDGGDAAPAELARSLRAVAGVAEAAVRYHVYGTLLDRNGRPAGGGEGLAMVDSVAAAKDLRWQQVACGHLPTASGQLVLDKVSAKRFGYGLGDDVRLLDADDEVQTFELVGIVDMEDSPQYAGTPYAGVTATQARTLIGAGAEVRVDVLASPGSDQEAVKAGVAAALPDGWRTYTSAQYTEKQLEEVSRELS